MRRRRVGQFNARIGDHLHQALQIMLGRYGNSDAIERIERMAFLARFQNTRFQRLIEREQPRFECFSLGNVVDGAADHRAGGSCEADLAPAPRSSAAAPSCADPEFDIEFAALSGCFHCRVDFWARHQRRWPFPIRLERVRSPVASNPKTAAAWALQFQFPRVEIQLECRDSAGGLAKSEPLLGRANPPVQFAIFAVLRHAWTSPRSMVCASRIARSLPSAICLGRWLKPQVLVMSVCSGASQS